MPTNTTKKATEVEEVVVEKKPTKKVFKDTDMIPCVSITYGKLLVVGDKSENLYRWIDFGDETEVEYRDLKSFIRSRKPCVYKPRFVIQDKDFLAEHKELEKIYGDLYSPADLRAILTYPASKMKEAIESLPLGAKEAIRDIACREIEDGVLDSIQRIKALDEIFGTQMLLKMTQ